MLLRFLTDKDGTTAIEYALIASIIGIGIIASLSLVGVELTAMFADLVTRYQNI